MQEPGLIAGVEATGGVSPGWLLVGNSSLGQPLGSTCV